MLLSHYLRHWPQLPNVVETLFHNWREQNFFPKSTEAQEGKLVYEMTWNCSERHSKQQNTYLKRAGILSPPNPPHLDPYPRDIAAILRIWQLKAKKPLGSEARAEPNTWT